MSLSWSAAGEQAASVTRSVSARLALTVAGAVGAMLVWLYIHNSGYGYDALEYLIIGRSLNEGYALYDFVPSKSWALYVVIAAFLKVPGAATHAGVASFTLVLLAAVIAATYAAVRALFGRSSAVVAAGLVFAGAMFMELNYIEPEPFVYVSGLAALVLLASSTRRDRVGYWLCAGSAIGCGVAFKAVAALYLVGLVLWIALVPSVRTERSSRQWFVRGVIFALGFGAVLAVPAIWMAATGRLATHIQWTYVFPSLHYPSSTAWAAETFRKLSWACVLIVAALAADLWMRRRQSTDVDDLKTLLLIVGFVSLVTLPRTQPSHYAFPGTAFLLMYVAVVIDQVWSARSIAAWAWRTLALVVALLAVAGGLAHRPDVLRRFSTVRTFDEETDVRRAVQSVVRTDERAIFLGGATRLYWTTHRYPSWNVLNTEVQTTFLIQTEGDRLLAAFDDPALVLVEFNPDRPWLFNDRQFLESPAVQRFLGDVSCRLNTDFIRRADLSPPWVFWQRRVPAVVGAEPCH